MKTVTSKDGTTIAYDRSGSGPVVIPVAGALQFRAFDQGLRELAALLSPHFTVLNYDRRGRGDSGDTQPFAVEREIEDIEALIDAAGGTASLVGFSSGACLAFEAALRLGGKVTHVAMYEPPYNAEESAKQNWIEYRRELKELVDAGRGGDATILFMQLVGLPDEAVEGMRQDPSFALFEPVGLTLAYDAAEIGDDGDVPLEKASTLTTPTLVMAGTDTYPFMRVTAKSLAEALPKGQHQELEGQTHEVDSKVLAPVLIEFFSA